MKKMGRPIETSQAGNIVAKTRHMLNVGQTEFATLLGLKRSAISLLESGKRNPTGSVVVLCKLLQKYPTALDMLKSLLSEK